MRVTDANINSVVSHKSVLHVLARVLGEVLQTSCTNSKRRI